jgi:hypothetical protein
MTTNERQTYQDRCEADLAEWNAQLARMRATADKADAGVQIEYGRTIDALTCRRAEAMSRLGKLKEASDDAFAEMKPRTEKAWVEIGSAFSNAPRIL